MFREISSAVHEAITREFEQDWRTYSSPTRAAQVVEENVRLKQQIHALRQQIDRELG